MEAFYYYYLIRSGEGGGKSYNTLRAKSTFKKRKKRKEKQPKTAVEKEEKKHTHTGVKSRSRGAERLTLGFSQPMLPAGQLDKRPQKHHIVTESWSRLSGKCLTAFFFKKKKKKFSPGCWLKSPVKGGKTQLIAAS